MPKSQKARVILGVVLVCVLAAGFWAAYTFLRPQPVQGEKSLEVVVVMPDSSETFSLKTDAEYLRQALEEISLIQGAESSYGFFITTVNGVAADDAKREWWRLSKDGEELVTGVDNTPIQDGERYEITLATY